MDAIALIISALTAGATAALQETAGTAINDAYKGLTTLIKQKFKKDPKATAALEGHAQDPEIWQKPLEKSIRETRVSEDQKILLAAQKLLELVHSQKSAPKFAVEIKGNVQGLIQGDHARVVINPDPPKKRRSQKPSKNS